jgi:hypothetical protein
MIVAMGDWTNNLKTFGYQGEVTLVLASGNVG